MNMLRLSMLSAILMLGGLLAGCAPVATSTGASAVSGDISISAGYATVNAGPNSSAYMIIANKGDKIDRLIGATTADATRVSLHETQNNNGVMLMLPAPNGFEIPARGKIELKPASKHLMLENVKRDLKIDSRVSIVLKFQSGLEMTLDLPVHEPGGVTHQH